MRSAACRGRAAAGRRARARGMLPAAWRRAPPAAAAGPRARAPRGPAAHRASARARASAAAPSRRPPAAAAASGAAAARRWRPRWTGPTAACRSRAPHLQSWCPAGARLHHIKGRRTAVEGSWGEGRKCGCAFWPRLGEGRCPCGAPRPGTAALQGTATLHGAPLPSRWWRAEMPPGVTRSHLQVVGCQHLVEADVTLDPQPLCSAPAARQRRRRGRQRVTHRELGMQSLAIAASAASAHASASTRAREKCAWRRARSPARALCATSNGPQQHRRRFLTPRRARAHLWRPRRASP